MGLIHWKMILTCILWLSMTSKNKNKKQKEDEEEECIMWLSVIYDLLFYIIICEINSLGS